MRRKEGLLFWKKEAKNFWVLVLVVSLQAHASELKLSTWNLEWLTARGRIEANLPKDVHLRQAEDFRRLAGYATKLNADVVGLQEVDGPQAAALVFDPQNYTILTTGQDVVQRVGLAIRRGIAFTRNPDYAALDVEPAAAFPLRDGLDVTLGLSGAARLRILVVHLKSGCQTETLAGSTRPQCALLAQQIPPLAAWVGARQREGVAFLVLGDFNRVLDAREELGTALAQAAPLTRVTEGFENPCWEGAPFIDHIFAGGAARGWVVPGSLRVQIFREGDEALKARLSDHCPVSIRLRF
jgi:endonuclease/exonuclease/phosphatase family metal-dependent hydrolase